MKVNTMVHSTCRKQVVISRWNPRYIYRAHEGESECRVSRSNFGYECQLSNVDQFLASVSDVIEKWDNVGCWKKPLRGYYSLHLR